MSPFQNTEIKLKGSLFFLHSGEFTNTRDVVEYFNAGVPQNPVTGAASTLTPRFTKPRGPNAPSGLGLSEAQVDAITDFIDNALYDPAFVKYDPNSTTITMQPNARDLTYSVYRPDLAVLGAKDGFVPSGLAISNNDPLSRRDEGLEFLDVSNELNVQLASSSAGTQQTNVYTIANKSTSIVDTHLLIIVRGLPAGVSLTNASAVASTGDPYLRVFLPSGVLNPGQSITETLVFQGPPNALRANYNLDFLSGQGNP